MVDIARDRPDLKPPSGRTGIAIENILILAVGKQMKLRIRSNSDLLYFEKIYKIYHLDN